MLKTITRIALVGVLVLGFIVVAVTSEVIAEDSYQNTDDSNYIVYYFHTDMRCATCKRIEAWSHEAVASGFADALKDDLLKWQVRNVDEEQYAHFLEDFNLYTKSLVIVEQQNGKTVRFKNLGKIWQLLRDKERFTDYVQEEIRAFMEKG